MSDQLIPIYKELIHHFGGQQQTAEALGVGQSSVSEWCKGKSKMRPITAAKAQDMSQGLFLAKDLCPELKEVLAILDVA